jgi:hypothetical protein
MQWLALEFDFTTGRYTGDYYDTSTINWFVDSDLGNDANAGTAAAPWKTIGKLISTAGVVNGHRVMINGIFTENTAITKQLRIIGCGGGRNGRTIFNNGGSGINIRYNTNITNNFLENVELVNYNDTLIFHANSAISNVTFISFTNCILNSVQFRTTNSPSAYRIFSYFTVYNSCNLNTATSAAQCILNLAGTNSIFFNCTRVANLGVIRVEGNNMHVNNTITVVNLGSNNILNTNGQYFSPANNDFNFPDTSPLYLTGTVDGITGIPNNVGAGRLGDFLNPSKYQYTIGGGAVFTNTEIDGTDIYRTDDTIDGRFRTGIVDMGQIRRGVIIGINNTFQFTGGELTKLIQETTGLTVRQGLDWKLIYGNSINEIQTKITANEWLLMEYGKMVTVTISLGITYGNADASFDPTDFIIPSFRMFVVEMRFKNA